MQIKIILLVIIYNLTILESMRISLGKSHLNIKLQSEIKQNIKLPVWPVWGGVLAQIAEWTGKEMKLK
jgi:hypothetical protein